MNTSIANIASHLGKPITIRGWLHNKRSSGKIMFLELRDGSGFIQAVVDRGGVDQDTWQAVNSLTHESSLVARGTPVRHPKKREVYELQVLSIDIVQLADEFPIGKKGHGPDFLMNNRHLWLRGKKQWAILKIRSAVEAAIHQYMADSDFIRVDSPVLTPNACEGTTTLFRVPYFDLGDAYLSQTGQLYIEAAIASLGRAYDFGPVFRAEKSTTKRHLSEFWMMDAEAAFVTHKENKRLQQDLIKAVVKHCLVGCAAELEVLRRNTDKLSALAEREFKTISYAQAVEELRALGSDITYGEDLGNDDESLLTDHADMPIFIEKWPRQIKPFYMKIDPDDEELVLNSDLIGIEGAGELIGGSQREDDYEMLKQRVKRENLPEKEFQWYLDLRRYGSVPHSGFGIGVERLVRWICGVEHIRECIPFPRTVNRLSP